MNQYSARVFEEFHESKFSHYRSFAGTAYRLKVSSRIIGDENLKKLARLGRNRWLSDRKDREEHKRLYPPSNPP